MSKQIHVNSYVKKDGTEVKEHYRNITTSNNIMPDEKEIPWSIYENSQEAGPIMSSNGNMVLEGYTVYNDRRQPPPKNSDNVLETIISVGMDIGSAAINIASAICNAIEAANFNMVSKLKPELDTAINSIKTTQVEFENLSKKYLDRLVKTKNKQEYENLLKTYTQQKAINQKMKDSLAKIQYASDNENYKTVFDELQNFQSNFDEVMKDIVKNRPIFSQNQQNNILAKSMLPPSPNIYANTMNKMAEGTILSKNVINASTKVLKPLIKDSEELWKAFSQDFTQSKGYIEKNGSLVRSVFDLPSQELQQIVTRKLQQQLGISDALGVIFQPDSSLSQAISNSNELKNFFIKNKDQLFSGRVVEKSSTHFDWRTNPNLGTGLGNADILYSYIDKNGNFYSIIFDTYDFNKGENILIDIGKIIQETNSGRSFYILSIILIPFSQWLFWL